MTIDTSREAVERLLEGVTPPPWEAESGHEQQNGQMYWQVTDKHDAIVQNQFCWCQGDHASNARFIAASRELVPALLAERDAALAEVARLSAPPDDAEVAALSAFRDWANKHAAIWKMGAIKMNGKFSRFMDPDTDTAWIGFKAGFLVALTRLSHALAAETAKREAMEEALRTAETDLFEAEDKFHIASFYISDEQTKQCVMDRVKWMAKAGRLVRETLAQHGKVK